jgi:hypothetical protein
MRRSINQDIALRRRTIELAQGFQNAEALVVLPPARHGRVGRHEHRKWLSRGRIHAPDRPRELFAAVLGAIGHGVPVAGLAALRFWGQVGERPKGWVAAADPVYLEARLDHLCLHSLPGDAVSMEEMRELFEFLKQALGDDERAALACLDCHGYLRGVGNLATASVSPQIVDGRPPDEFMPAGEGQANYDLLLSELQMALHDHDVNLRRAANGSLPINSLWIWGGGSAPDVAARPIPPLIAGEPLLRGYWHSCGGAIESWPGDFERCLSIAPNGFVAIAPVAGESTQSAALDAFLEELRLILKRGGLRKLTLVFRDGLRIELRSGDSLRFWRQISSHLIEASDDG